MVQPKTIIITSARSGSHHLAEIIARSKGERLRNFEILGALSNSKKKDEKVDTFELIQKIKDAKGGSVFTLLEHQIKENDIELYKLGNNLKKEKFIILNRVNKLDQYVSKLLAEKNHNYRLEDYEKKIGLGALSYYTWAKDNIDYYHKVVLNLEKSSASYKTINYTGRFSKSSLKDIFEYLKLEIKTEIFDDLYFKVQRKKKISEYIDNQEALKVIKEIRFII